MSSEFVARNGLIALNNSAVLGNLSASTLQITNLASSANTNFLVASPSGTVTYRNDVLTGATSVSSTTLSGNILSVGLNGGTTTATTINAATGGTYSNGTITLSGTGTLSNITGLPLITPYDTGFTYNSANTFTITNNTGGTLSATFNTVTGLTTFGGISASSNIARGLYVNNSFSAVAVNDVLVGVDLSPTYSVNPNTGNTAIGLRILGSYSPSAFTTNNTYAALDINPTVSNANYLYGVRIRPNGTNIQNFIGLSIESGSFAVYQSATTAFNLLGGQTAVGFSSVPGGVGGYNGSNDATLNVINGTNGGIKVGTINSKSQHLIISHSETGSTSSSILNTYSASGAKLTIGVAGISNFVAFGSGNVVINGSTDNGYKLDVVGTFRASSATITTFLSANTISAASLTVSASTNPLKLVGLTSSTGDTNYLTIDATGVVHQKTLTGQIILGAAGSWPSQSSGSSYPAVVQTTTNRVNYYSVGFAPSAQTFSEWGLSLPSDFATGGTINANFLWLTNSSSTGTSGTTVWGIQGIAYGNGTAIDTAYGSAVEVPQANQGSNVVNISSASTNVTLAGSPSPTTHAQFRVYRKGSGADVLSATTQLLEVKLSYTRT
jgi:hypothetical protein